MAANPMVPMAAGDNRTDIQYTPSHPQSQDPQAAIDALISKADLDRLVSIVTTYRTGWAPNRLLHLAQWMRNQLFYRGHQILGWDQSQGVWYDALALYMQSGKQQEGEDTYLQNFQNNVTKMLGTAFVGTMSRSVPPTVIRPENAEVLEDTTTAKAAQEAISIIERMNDIRGIVRNENTLLYLYGVYFKHTRTVIDGSWAGYDEQPVIGPIDDSKPARFHCPQCGADIPPNAVRMGASTEDGDSLACPQCDTTLTPADFYPAQGPSGITGNIGTKRVPRAMIKWDVHGPLEIDVDPEAKKVKDTPLLALEMEVDLGSLRQTYPQQIQKIMSGAQSSTTPNATFERLRRNESYSQGTAYTTDSYQTKPTLSQIWCQPQLFYKDETGDKDQEGLTFAQRMEKSFPDGLKLTMCANETLDIRPACLEKEWTACVLIENCGMYPPSVADDVVPFNIRINGAMDIMDDYFQRCTTGMTLANSAMIDRREYAGKSLTSGVLNFVDAKKLAPGEPLTNAVAQFQFHMDQDIMQYVPMLFNYVQQIAGLPPQVFGIGTQQGVETAKGQNQQLGQAQEKLNIFFENEKAEHAEASQNAIEWLQKAFKQGLVKEIWDVVQSEGSQFRNNYVNLEKMRGRVRVYGNVDQGLPQSPEALREVYQMLFEEQGKGNPAAVEMMSLVPNQEVVMASLGSAELVLPKAAQRARTLQQIQLLLDGAVDSMGNKIPGPMIVMPDGSTGYDLPTKPEIWTDDFQTLQETVKLFKQENWDLAKGNPVGWANITKFQDLADQLDMQEMAQKAQRQKQVTQAGAPDPDPAMEQAKALLLSDAQGAVQQNAEIGSSPAPPAGTQLGAVVTANKGIVDAALKAYK